MERACAERTTLEQKAEITRQSLLDYLGAYGAGMLLAVYYLPQGKADQDRVRLRPSGP
jgi:hypothetical protein